MQSGRNGLTSEKVKRQQATRNFAALDVEINMGRFHLADKKFMPPQKLSVCLAFLPPFLYCQKYAECQFHYAAHKAIKTEVSRQRPQPVAVEAAKSLFLVEYYILNIFFVFLTLNFQCNVYCGGINRRYNGTWRHKNDGIVAHGGKMEAA